MRGNPLVRILVVIVGICAMGFPVWRLTEGVAAINSTVPLPSVPSIVSANESYSLDLEFAHPPDSFVLSYLGQPILTGGKANSFQGGWKTSLPKEGDDLLLKANWPPGTPRTAIEVRVDRAVDGQTMIDKTVWSDHPLTTIITVMPPSSSK